MEIRTRNRVIAFRVTPAERREIEAKVRQSGLCQQEYLLHAALETPILVVEDLKPLLGELRAWGRNLNQLTTLANMGRVSVVKGDALAENYGKIYEQLRELLREVSGAPTKAVNHFCGERRHPGMSELSADQAGSE